MEIRRIAVNVPGAVCVCQKSIVIELRIKEIRYNEHNCIWVGGIGYLCMFGLIKGNIKINKF